MLPFRFPRQSRPTLSFPAPNPLRLSPQPRVQCFSLLSALPPSIKSKLGVNLHLQKNHPLHLIKTRIENHFLQKKTLPHPYAIYDNLSPVVSVNANFDELLIPPDHESRSPVHSYFLDKETVLRTHTSAHQSHLLKKGEKAFLVVGDVYRRDTVDATHYPVFHQMEGVYTFPMTKKPATEEQLKGVEEDLKSNLDGLVKDLFGSQTKVRWIDAYFPFTSPSWEMEIFFQEKWLEVLGCGIVQQPIMQNSGRGEELGWAFGLGLERLAMILFGIPDIRLFWSQDLRFHSQFQSGDISKIGKFKPYSKFPECKKDISFWVPDTFHENDFFELIREEGKDLVESVEMIDSFVSPKTKKKSVCYRINYRSMDKNLTNEEINQLQEKIRVKVVNNLKVELR